MTLDAPEREALLRSWTALLDCLIDLDRMVEIHSHFYQIPALRLGDLHARSFLIAETAFATQLAAAAALSAEAGNGRDIETFLDEERPELGLRRGGYSRLKRGITRPDDLLRLAAGRAELKLLEAMGRLGSPVERGLAAEARARTDAVARALPRRLDLAIDNPMDVLEGQAFRAWFPLQKGTAEGLSRVRAARRDYLISMADLERARARLEPGDVLLERRNWYLSNIGLPGFWPHAAMYVGTLAEMDGFFADVVHDVTGKGSVSEAVAATAPAVAEAFARADDGHPPRIIEAIGKGVVLSALEHSGHADYLAALRPRLGKADRLRAILAALSCHGRPYDYNFDFLTDGELVCSELVYKAYREAPGKAGLHFDLVRSAGRWVLPPTEIARAFDQRLGTGQQELDLVVFLDGSEAAGCAVERDAESFRTTWKRPKWDVLQE